MDKIIIYGAGIRCARLCDILKGTKIEIVAIVDSNPKKWDTYIEGYCVCPPEKIKDFLDVNLCIAIENWDAVQVIRRDLQNKFQYNLEQEIGYEKFIFKAYQQHTAIINRMAEEKVEVNEKSSILFDCFNGLGLGGIESWTINLCSALRDKGHENIYIISKKGNYDIPQKLQNKILFADIDMENRFSEDSIINIINLIIKKLPCTVITSQVNEVLLAASLIKNRYSDLVEIISVIHNGDKKTYEQYMSISEYMNLFIGVSQEIRKDMIAHGLEDNRLYDMTCPFDCKKEISRSYTEDKLMPIRIGYAGRMDKVGVLQKRMDLLLKFAKLLDINNVNYVFELAGDGPARNEMEDFVHINKLEKKIQFLGILNRTEISAFWERQDIFVNFADFEGRCISKLEAMANGVVPITTNTVGTREDIDDGVNGFVVSIGDYKSMVDRVIYLDQHRDRLKEMGILAHDKIYPKSLMNTHISFWEDILKLK